MSNIYDFSLSYSLVKRHVIFTFKRFFSDYIITGRENLPPEGPVIFAPNHLNALMDALAAISVLPHKTPIVFLGRADLFNNETAAKVLRFSKIMPAFRMRDGAANLEKNHGIFELCVDVLNHNKALGIMPEGNQGGFRRLRPLVKGIFRIAFSAQEKYGLQPGVKIVPIGIDYGDLVKFRKHIIVNIGKPIEVSDYMAEYNENPVNATNQIRERLSKDICDLTLNLATENHYDCFETATEVANTAVVKELQMPDKTLFRFKARQKIAERLVALENEEPEKIEKLETLCTTYKENLNKLNLHSWLLEKKQYKMGTLLLTGLMLLCTFPIFLVGFLLNMLPFYSPLLIRKALKITYPGGLSSVHLVFSLVTFPVFYLLQAIVIFNKIKAAWWIIILFFPMQYLLGKFAFQWYRKFKKLRIKFGYRKLEKQKSPVLEQTKLLHDQIIEMVQARA